MKSITRKLTTTLCLVTSLLFATANFASAASGNYTSSVEITSAAEPEVLWQIAKGFGSAELQLDSSGDPFIMGRIDGIKYGVYFYGCKDGKDCKDVQFTASWVRDDITLEDMNAWNRDKRFGKAYLDKDNDPTLEMVVNLNYGVTKENMEDTFDWWASIIKSFAREVLGN